jgi:hypothetical protein
MVQFGTSDVTGPGSKYDGITVGSRTSNGLNKLSLVFGQVDRAACEHSSKVTGAVLQAGPVQDVQVLLIPMPYSRWTV